jgi:pimeloyl-ACP methyl ester carboxylesterase
MQLKHAKERRMGTTNAIISKDGTTIAFDKMGQGPAVLLVDGALSYRAFSSLGTLADLLAEDFTVFHYDRRGRGESSDTPPYAVEREIEDIAALIQAAGGSVYMYGKSSGSVLALRAAAQLGPKLVTKLALQEPPFSFGDEAKQEFTHYTEQMNELINANKKGDAVAFFLADMLSEDGLAEMRKSPEWALMEAVAPTLAYDNAVLDDGLLPVKVAQAATMPALVIDSTTSLPFQREAAAALAQTLPDAEYVTLETETPEDASEALAAALAEIFS